MTLSSAIINIYLGEVMQNLNQMFSALECNEMNIDKHLLLGQNEKQPS